MEKTVVAIDLGATSGRVVLTRHDGKTLDMETLHRFPTPLVEEDGKYWWDIHLIYEEMIAGLAKAAGRGVQSIGIDTWGVDFCAVDAAGKVARPRAYRDPYTSGMPEQFFALMPREELYRRTGIQIMNFNSVFQMFAQRESLPSAGSILFVPDALGYLLTGNKACEYTILSTSALMNPRSREFDSDILALCGLRREQFPQIVMPGTVLGTLTEEAARATGLGKVPVISVAGHDTASAVAAVPATEANFAYLSSGTWSLMGIETPVPVIDERMAAMNYTNEGGAGGNIRLLKNITGMWLLEQSLAAWRAEGRSYSYAQLKEMAAGCPKSGKFINPDDPDFAAPQDMPRTICAKLGQSLGDAQLVRLIYDSLAARYAEVFHNLEAIAGRKLDVLHIIGGGSQNELLDQMTADACRVKVVAGPAEGTALGNVMIQMGLTRAETADKIETKTYLPR